MSRIEAELLHKQPPIEIVPEFTLDMLFSPGWENTLHLEDKEDNQLRQYTERFMGSFLEKHANVIEAWKEFGLFEKNYHNIIEHNVMTAMAGYHVGVYIGLPEEDCTKIAVALLLHDADKYDEITALQNIKKLSLSDGEKIEKISQEEKNLTENRKYVLSKLNFSEEIIMLSHANMPIVLEEKKKFKNIKNAAKTLQPQTTMAQIVFAIDLCYNGSYAVPVEQRFKDTRNPDKEKQRSEFNNLMDIASARDYGIPDNQYPQLQYAIGRIVMRDLWKKMSLYTLPKNQDTLTIVPENFEYILYEMAKISVKDQTTQQAA